ncbi:MAG: ParB N-terminal domain-containing protein [Deltaproteobacteria bacterium]|jgi:ParB/RepB/Spo0J family partition protein|nr:ParB N-terminal domain-containing protein [Deltaproteobacteria bacterium]
MISGTSVFPAERIDLDDETYLIGGKGDLRPLLESIREWGLINPILLQERKDQRYRIISGRRRLLCCIQLGWSGISARVATDALSDLDCLKIAVSDNRSHRPLNLIEQSDGIHKLEPHFSEKEGFTAISLLLDIPLNLKVFQKIRGLARLDTRIQEEIVRGGLSLEGAVALFPFEPSEQMGLFELMKELNLSQNKECELIELVDEIARRETVSPLQVIRSNPIRKIMENRDQNRPEKTRKVRSYLKQKRFPSITEAEDRFCANLGTLKLGNSIRLSPPPSFEGSAYSVRFSFKTAEEFTQRMETLQEASKKPAFNKIMQKK